MATPPQKNIEVLVRRLRMIAALSDDECEALRGLPLTVRELPPGQDIVREGDSPTQCCIVLSGFTVRYKLVGEGSRQILAFHVPGDIPDLQSLHLMVLDHNLASLTAARVGLVQHSALHALHARYPRIAGALWRESLIEASIFREWIVGLGQRNALRRTAHLLCEMFFRLDAVGLAEPTSVELPITQSEFADALGLSKAHVNRSLQELRARGLIVLKAKSLVIPDWEALKEVADFDPGYLHLTPDLPPQPP